jgi:alpha-galactosidase
MILRMILSLLVVIFICQFSQAEGYATFHENILKPDNGIIEREIEVEDESIFTKHFKLKGNDFIFNSGRNSEFSLLIDVRKCDEQSGWDLISFFPVRDNYQGDGATVAVEGTKAFSGIEVHLTYLFYPDLPVIWKRIQILNNTGKEIVIESLDIEKLRLGFRFISSVVYINYGRQKHLSTYIGDWDDPVVAVHSYTHNARILLGNESPGVLKRTACNWSEHCFNIV